VTRKAILIIFILFSGIGCFAQFVPAEDENIPYLMTFGGNSNPSWGDDDFCQIFFCIIPKSEKNPFYIRIFDPDTGSNLDELKGDFNTVINFSVYGGSGCWSDTAAQSIHPGKDSFKTGYLMSSKSFGADPRYDKQWYTLGPFNPLEGEYVEEFGGRVFKIVAQGISGDDGNIYNYFMSTVPDNNIPVEGGNLFTYKYHFRLTDDPNAISQVYPFIDSKTVSIEISNFDWDNDGIIRLLTVAKNGLISKVSGENNWVSTIFPIVDEEKNTTIEVQFIKNKRTPAKNNNVVLTIRNQYGLCLPFYVIPIGGIPKYVPRIIIK
jgi:hypothetical protein